MLYGANVYGTPISTIKAVRGSACALKGELRGRSTFARLQLAGYDAGSDLTIGPIFEWAKACWDGLASKETLQVTWQRAQCVVGVSQRPFGQVCGPAGATIASCMRLGWKSPSPRHFINADGVLLDLDFLCPLQVKLHAEDDCLRAEAASSTLATRIGGPPDLGPLRSFITSKKVRGSPAASSLAALGEGGWWAQERLFQEGRVPDPYCRACGDRQGLGPAIGSIHHRCCACPATADLREAHKKQEVISLAQSALHCHEPLFCHGVPMLLGKPAVPDHSVRCCGGRQPPADFTFTGNAFIDGALRGAFLERAAELDGLAFLLKTVRMLLQDSMGLALIITPLLSGPSSGRSLSSWSWPFRP